MTSAQGTGGTASASVTVAAFSNRIFMSTNGNNASDCANPLTPCLTFAGALAQVAVGGEVIAEATGGYGPLNITQAVTISGPPGVVIYSGLPVTVNAPGATVVLRGLTIDGTGAAASGILVQAAGSLFVESCVIANFSGSGANGNGIYLATAGNLFVKDTLVQNNSSIGIWVNPASGTAEASIEHCRFDGNGSGSSNGLTVSNSGNMATVKDSTATGLSGYGLGAESGAELNIENCEISSNAVGVESISSSTVRVSDTTVTENGTGLSSSSAALLSRGNNTVEGNTANGTFTSTYMAK